METTSKMYRVRWGEDIQEIEVLSQTAKFVTIKTVNGGKMRESKDADWQKYFKLREDAVLYVRKSLQARIDSVHRNLATLQEKLNKFNANELHR